jgi:hypothetical protein
MTSTTAVPATPLLAGEVPGTMISSLAQEIIERRLVPGILRQHLERWLRDGINDGSRVIRSIEESTDGRALIIYQEADGTIRLAYCEVINSSSELTDLSWVGADPVDQANSVKIWVDGDTIHYLTATPMSGCANYLELEVLDRELEGFIRGWYAVINLLKR